MLLRGSASLLLLLAGCIAAPREVETTLELGAQKVEIDVKVKDIRAIGADDLRQLDTFATFAKWDKDWISEMPWAPTPAKFEYVANGARLDLALHGSMPRAEFDRCAGADGGCPSFPVTLGKAGYAVSPEVLGLKSLTIDPKQKAAWPADVKKLTFTVAFSGDPDTFVLDGPSLLRGYQLWSQSPAKAAETLAKIKAAEEKRAEGKEWNDVACTEVPWCGLEREALNRDRVRLVYRYLAARADLVSHGLRSPPAQTIDYLGSTFVNVAPKESFAPADELKLRILYDEARDGFRELGSARAEWTLVCRADAMKKPALKEFCGRLGVAPAKK